MKKIFLLCSFFTCSLLFAQTEEELFGSADDDFFFDDGIEEFVETKTTDEAVDLSKGVLFQTGSVEISGNFDLSLTTYTTFNKDTKTKDSFENTILIPAADAQIIVDARPSENLRLYLKSGINYPYVTESKATIVTSPFQQKPTTFDFKNMFYVKELFGDFNIGPNVAFRFGKQTVTWGVGYFFSPADVINLTAIDPENPTAQVEGPLALRTQVVFPGTQHAIWTYIIPENPVLYVEGQGAISYAKNTAFAAKGDIVIGPNEFGIGGWYKYQNSPRAMLTFSGTIFRNYSIFAEGVLAFGKDSAWLKNSTEDKKPIFQTTAGIMRFWKDQNITVASQYYYNQQEDAANASFSTHGHNAAIMCNFGKIGTDSFSSQIFAMMNFNKVAGIASVMLKYNPINEFSISCGPYFDWKEDNLSTSIKLVFDFGSGKF